MGEQAHVAEESTSTVLMSLEHDELMKQVCVCKHRMEDHAWTADDAYCMMGECRCPDFDQHPNYERFRDQVLVEALQDKPKICTTCNDPFFGPQQTRPCGHGAGRRTTWSDV